MSELTFTARVVHFSKDEDYYMVGLADDEYEHQNYIVMQRAFEFDEQDIAQGMDGEYIEVNEESGYKICRKAVLENKLFSMEYGDGTTSNTVKILLDEISVDSVWCDYLREILGSKLTVTV